MAGDRVVLFVAGTATAFATGLGAVPVLLLGPFVGRSRGRTRGGRGIHDRHPACAVAP